MAQAQSGRPRSYHHFTDSDSDSDSEMNLGDLFTDSDFNLGGAYDNTSGSIPVQITDPDLLDCPICANPLCSQIYQCEHGHIACSSCCVKVNNKCPSCCSPIGFIRCLVLEKLIESMKLDCKNKRFGCKKTLIYHKKSDHETTCPHSPCFCPLPSCNFASSSKNLYTHFSSLHSSSGISFTYDNVFFLDVNRNQKHVILRERNEGVIFILNHETQGHGRVFNVDCIGPNAFKKAFVYQLTVKIMESCLFLETVPEVCSKWKEHTPDDSYLTIPSRFSDFHIKVCIKKSIV